MINAFLSLGRWIFPVPFAVTGLLQIMNVQMLADEVVPAFLPLKIIWVYLSGASLIAAAASMYLERYDKLATALLAVLLLLVVLLVHVPGAMSGEQGAAISMTLLLKDTGLMAASMLYARHLAKDRSVIG